MSAMSDTPSWTSSLPRFKSIDPARIETTLRRLLDENRAELGAVLARQPQDWDELVVPLERMHHRLARFWSPVSHLNSVLNGPELRAAYNACLPLLTAYHTELAQNADLCAAYGRLLEHDGASLDAPQRKLLENALRDFRLAGVSLPDDRKARFRSAMERLATVQAKFDENVLDSTQAFTRQIDDQGALAGLPATVIERARRAAEAADATGWRLVLDAPTYQAVLAHAEDEPLRREFYEAWVTRASDRGPHADRWDNAPLMDEILALRHEIATLAGFANYAEYSLATKMARDPAEVLAFLGRLAAVARPVAEREFAALEAFAGRSLAAWDVTFFAERLKRERLDVAEEALRPYFPLPRALEGLFAVVARLYGVGIVERNDVEVYHPEVRFFAIHDRAGQPRAGFFLDPYARPGKRGGAWMDECVGRMQLGADSALPVAYLVCNFSPPQGTRPSLLTHHEVLTLFHEFGHGLHHMLTCVDYPSVAGINGVPWDAVELPSQFMENFAWRAEVLPLVSAHVETGAPLPVELLEKLQATRTFSAGMQTVRQLEFSLFDFRVHAEYRPGQPSRIFEILAEVRNEVAVVRAPEFNRFPQSFQHVFSGGYAAGYYSYKWAEVLSADAFSAFEANGVFDARTARRFEQAILEQGGGRDALEAFVDFRGRPPEIEPLLRQMGLAA
jgi:oligopeptidase A